MAESPASQNGRTASRAPGAIEQAQPAQEQPSINLRSGRPIVIKVKGKAKKRKYSRSLKTPQKGMRKLNKAGHKLARAITSGFAKYRKKSGKSAWKKRDGMLKDVFKNSASGLGVSLRKGSTVPRILAKTISGRRGRKNFRVLSRITSLFGRY